MKKRRRRTVEELRRENLGEDAEERLYKSSYLKKRKRKNKKSWNW